MLKSIGGWLICSSLPITWETNTSCCVWLLIQTCPPSILRYMLRKQGFSDPLSLSSRYLTTDAFDQPYLVLVCARLFMKCTRTQGKPSHFGSLSGSRTPPKAVMEAWAHPPELFLALRMHCAFQKPLRGKCDSCNE